MRSAGIELRKWATNHADVVADLPLEYLEKATKLSFDREDETIKALGLYWNPKNELKSREKVCV